MQKPGARRGLATAAVLLALIVAALEGTVVTVAMPSITLDLGGRDAYAWVFTAFLLASMVGILTCGKLADAFGRRPVFIAGMGVFLVGSMLSGLARDMPSLIGFRVLQGLGAGAIQPIAMTISADLYTLTERAKVQALFTTAWGSANALGPILGGFIVDHTSWRWVFFVNVPIGVVTVVMLLLSYRDPPRERGRATGVAGALLGGVGVATALLALEPSEHGTPWVRALLLAAAGTLFVAFAQQQQRALEPLLPRALLSDAVVRTGLLASVFVGAITHACAAYVPLWLTTDRHASPIEAGAALVALLVAWAFASSFGVRVLVRWGMRVSVGGGFVFVALGGAALAATVRFDLPINCCLAALTVLGLGLGPAASTSLVASQSHVPWRLRGSITSVIYACRMLGGALMVATLGAFARRGPTARFEAVFGVATVAVVLLMALAPTRVTEATEVAS